MKSWTLRFRQKDKKNFDEIKEGSKEYETRAASVKYLPIKEGDTLIFVCGKEKLSKKIIKCFHWRDIDSMVEEIPFKKIMPSISSLEEMKKIYNSYPGYEEKIKSNGLFGFQLE